MDSPSKEVGISTSTQQLGTPQPIIPPVEREAIITELSKNTFVRITNYCQNEIHVVDGTEAPHTLREIGRLRELSFRSAGGGTGNELDLDHFDTREKPYKQMIVWSPKHKEILGGYRFFDCSKADMLENNKPDITMSRLFDYSEEYLQDYLPHTIELGRSFVQPEFQLRNSKEAVFVLDNLWDGIGTISNRNSHIQYLFGKVSIYPHVHPKAIQLMLSFLTTYFTPEHPLVTAVKPYPISGNDGVFSGKDFAEDYKYLKHELKDLNERIPALVNAYMKLTPTFTLFSTTINTFFGNLVDSAIQITIDEIHDHKKKRYFSVQ